MVRYLALKKETEYGTHVTPDKFIDIVSESIAYRNNVIYVENVNTVDFLKQVAGPYGIAGDFDLKIEPENIGHILLGLFGQVTSEQQGETSAYKHTFKPIGEDTELPSFTFEVGIGAITARRIAGCKIRRLSLSCAAGDLLLGSVTLVGKKDAIEDLQTPSFSALPPFAWNQATVTRAGSTIKPTAVEVNYENILSEDEYRLSTDRTIQELPWLSRRISGRIDLKFANTDDLKLFYGAAAATEPQETIETVALNLKFVSALIEAAYYYTLELDIPRVVYDIANANVNVRDKIIQSIEWTALYDATATYAAKAELTNKVTSYS